MAALAITFLIVLKGVEYNKISNYFSLKPVTCGKPFTTQELLNTSHNPKFSSKNTNIILR